MYYTYVLESVKDHQWYTGMTTDLKRRMANHLKGEVTSTSNRRPLKLVYYEACLNEADAKRRERYLKSGKGKRYLKQRLAKWIGTIPVAKSSVWGEDRYGDVKIRG